MTKATRNENGSFAMNRRDSSFELVCERCLRPKVTKVEVVWTTPDGRRKSICNACYGRLLSGRAL